MIKISLNTVQNAVIISEFLSFSLNSFAILLFLTEEGRLFWCSFPRKNNSQPRIISRFQQCKLVLWNLKKVYANPRGKNITDS